MKKLFLVVVALLLISCATLRDREKIRDGLLTMDLRQAAFLEEWGKPDRTYVTSGQDIVTAGWSGASGGFFKGKEAFEVWVYERKKTELVFNRKKTLTGWKTNATVQELSAPAR